MAELEQLPLPAPERVYPLYLARCCLAVVLELGPDAQGRWSDPLDVDGILQLRLLEDVQLHGPELFDPEFVATARLAISRVPERRAHEFAASDRSPEQIESMYQQHVAYRRLFEGHMRLAVDLLAAEGVIVAYTGGETLADHPRPHNGLPPRSRWTSPYWMRADNPQPWPAPKRSAADEREVQRAELELTNLNARRIAACLTHLPKGSTVRWVEPRTHTWQRSPMGEMQWTQLPEPVQVEHEGTITGEPHLTTGWSEPVVHVEVPPADGGHHLVEVSTLLAAIGVSP